MINRALLAYIKAASRFLLAFELGTYYGSVENYGFRDYPRNSFMLRSDSPVPFFWMQMGLPGSYAELLHWHW